jgi:hypothetical protein
LAEVLDLSEEDLIVSDRALVGSPIQLHSTTFAYLPDVAFGSDNLSSERIMVSNILNCVEAWTACGFPAGRMIISPSPRWNG